MACGTPTPSLWESALCDETPFLCTANDTVNGALGQRITDNDVRDAVLGVDMAPLESSVFKDLTGGLQVFNMEGSDLFVDFLASDLFSVPDGETNETRKKYLESPLSTLIDTPPPPLIVEEEVYVLLSEDESPGTPSSKFDASEVIFVESDVEVKEPKLKRRRISQPGDPQPSVPPMPTTPAMPAPRTAQEPAKIVETAPTPTPTPAPHRNSRSKDRLVPRVVKPKATRRRSESTASTGEEVLPVCEFPPDLFQQLESFREELTADVSLLISRRVEALQASLVPTRKRRRAHL